MTTKRKMNGLVVSYNGDGFDVSYDIEAHYVGMGQIRFTEEEARFLAEAFMSGKVLEGDVTTKDHSDNCVGSLPTNKLQHPISRLIKRLQDLPEGTTYEECEKEFWGGETPTDELGARYRLRIDIVEGFNPPRVGYSDDAIRSGINDRPGTPMPQWLAEEILAREG